MARIVPIRPPAACPNVTTLSPSWCTSSAVRLMPKTGPKTGSTVDSAVTMMPWMVIELPHHFGSEAAGGGARLRHARGAGGALVDGGIEMKERVCGRQLGAGGGLPVALMIDAPHRVGWDGFQRGLHGGEVVRGQLEALVAHELGERDAE